jgi:hypothetical protein
MDSKKVTDWPKDTSTRNGRIARERASWSSVADMWRIDNIECKQ